MDECNYKIFNNNRLMPKQEKKEEKKTKHSTALNTKFYGWQKRHGKI